MKHHKKMLVALLVANMLLLTVSPIKAVGDWINSGSDIYFNTGNIGIGSSTPNGKLHIQDSTTNLNANNNFSNRISPLSIGDADGSGYTILMDSNQIEQTGSTPLYMNLNSSQNIIMTNGGGKVGIGNASPAGKLDVGGSFYTYTGGLALRSQDSTNEGGQISFLGASSNPYFYLDNSSGRLRFISQDTVDESEKFTILNNGNVGVNTSTPAEKLSVNGTIQSTSGGFKFPDGTTQTTANQWSPNSSNIFFNSGNVGIGTNSPAYKLHVAGDSVLGNNTNGERFIFNPRTSFGGDFLQITADDGSGSWMWDKGITLSRNGKVGVGTTSPTFSQLQIQDSSVPLSFRESDKAVDAGGLWRVPLDDGNLRIDVNTAASGSEFSTYKSLMTMNKDGDVCIGKCN